LPFDDSKASRNSKLSCVYRKQDEVESGREREKENKRKKSVADTHST